MQHPAIASANAKLRYHQLVQEADLHRQMRLLKPSSPGLLARALSYVAGILRSLNTEAMPAATRSTSA
jgi:hypothetical protein